MNAKSIKVTASVMLGLSFTITFIILLEIVMRPIMRGLSSNATSAGSASLTNWTELIVRLFLFDLIPSLFGTYISGLFYFSKRRLCRLITGTLLIILFPTLQIIGSGSYFITNYLNWIIILIPQSIAAFSGAFLALLIGRDIQLSKSNKYV